MNLEAEQAIMVGDDIGERFFFHNFKALFYYYCICILYNIFLFIKMYFFQNYSTL